MLQQQVQQHERDRRAQAALKAAEGAAYKQKVEQEHAVVEVRGTMMYFYCDGSLMAFPGHWVRVVVLLVRFVSAWLS